MQWWVVVIASHFFVRKNSSFVTVNSAKMSLQLNIIASSPMEKAVFIGKGSDLV
jgi:hypothetical protein